MQRLQNMQDPFKIITELENRIEKLESRLAKYEERQVDLRIDGVVRKYTLLIKELVKFSFTIVE